MRKKQETLPPPAPGSLAARLDEYHDTTFAGRSFRTKVLSQQALKHMEIFTGQNQLDNRWYARWTEEAYRRWAPITARGYIGQTRRFLKWLLSQGYLQKDPRASLTAMKVVTKPVKIKEPITRDEYVALKEAAKGSVMSPYVVLGWATGMRASDCCLLTWADVSMEKMEISVIQYKTRRFQARASIPFQAGSDLHQMLIEQAALPRLETWPNKPEEGRYYVVPELAALYKRQIGSRCESILAQKFAKLCKKAGVEGKSFHCFRVALCTELANSNVSTVLACSISGHSDPKVFMRYVRADTDARRNAMLQIRSGIGS